MQETHASGDAGRHVTALSLDDRKNGQGTTTELLVHLDGTLEETRVEVEDVTGVSLMPGRMAEEGYLMVSNSLLGHISKGDVVLFTYPAYLILF